MELLKYSQASEQLEALANQHAIDHNVDYYTAYDAVSKTHPDLTKRAINAVNIIEKTKDPDHTNLGLPSSLPTALITRPRAEVEQELVDIRKELNESSDAFTKRQLTEQLHAAELELDVLDDDQQQGITKMAFTKQLQTAKDLKASIGTGGDPLEIAHADLMIEGAQVRLDGLLDDPSRSQELRQKIVDSDAPLELKQFKLDALDVDEVLKLNDPIVSYQHLEKLRKRQAEALLIISNMNLADPNLNKEHTTEEIRSYHETVEYFEEELSHLDDLIDHLKGVDKPLFAA